MRTIARSNRRRNQGCRGRALAYRADIADRAQVRELFASIDRSPGRLDIVVNNADVSTGGALVDVRDEDIADIFGINVFGPLHAASEAATRLGAGGRIINFRSSIARFPLAGAGLYSAANSAVESFT